MEFNCTEFRRPNFYFILDWKRGGSLVFCLLGTIKGRLSPIPIEMPNEPLHCQVNYSNYFLNVSNNWLIPICLVFRSAHFSVVECEGWFLLRSISNIKSLPKYNKRQRVRNRYLTSSLALDTHIPFRSFQIKLRKMTNYPGRDVCAYPVRQGYHPPPVPAKIISNLSVLTLQDQKEIDTSVGWLWDVFDCRAFNWLLLFISFDGDLFKSIVQPQS